MNANICSRCKENFYSALSSRAACPYCGFTAQAIEKRTGTRAAIKRECELSSFDTRLSSQTVDISERGVCVNIAGSTPFRENDTLRAVIRDFDLDSETKVVWIKSMGGIITMAGLKFC